MNELRTLSDEELKKYEDEKALLQIYDHLRHQKEILRMVADGLTAKEIGKELFKSRRTIENYVFVMMRMVGAKNKTQLVATAIRLKIIS